MNKTVMMAAVAAFMLSVSPVFACEGGYGGPGAPGEGMGKGPGGDQKGSGAFFQKIDTDGDGAISSEEFMASHEDHFKKMDADGDGKVTQEEMHNARQAMKDKRQEKRKERYEEKRGSDEDDD